MHALPCTACKYPPTFTGSTHIACTTTLIACTAMLILSCPSTSTYYKVDYELIMLFGGMELKTQLAWKENVSSSFPFFSGCRANNRFSVEKPSTAKIVCSNWMVHLEGHCTFRSCSSSQYEWMLLLFGGRLQRDKFCCGGADITTRGIQDLSARPGVGWLVQLSGRYLFFWPTHFLA